MDEKDIEVIDLTGESEEDSETWTADDDEDSKMDLDSEYSSEDGDHWPDQVVQQRWATLLGHWRREGITEGTGTLTGLLRALDPFIFGTAEDIDEYAPDPRRTLRRVWAPELGVLPQGTPAAPSIRRTARRRAVLEEDSDGDIGQRLFPDSDNYPEDDSRRED